MKNIMKIAIGKMKAVLGWNHEKSTHEEYARVIEKFGVVKKIHLTVSNRLPVLRMEDQMYDSHM